MRSKLQNACLYKTAPNQQGCSISNDVEWSLFFMKVLASIKSEDYSTKLRILKTNYIGQGWWCGKHSVDDILDKMKGNPQCNIMICKLLMDPACAIRLSRRKVLFSDLKFLNMTPLNNDSRKVLHFSNLTVLNSHKERTAKFAPHHPPLQKRWSPAPAL